MSLVFAAVLPHSPLLVPTIHSSDPTALNQTLEAIKTLTARLHEARPDVLIILTPHLTTTDEALAINLSTSYRIQFSEFGEYTTTLSATGDTLLAYRLKQLFDAERPATSITTITDERLDYGASVPLFFLLREQVTLPVIVIGDTLPTLHSQLAIGQQMGQALAQESKRVAIVASANLSHRLNQKSPAGFSPKAATFDRRVLEAIRHGEVQALARFRQETLQEVQECGLRSILLLCGILDRHVWQPEILSYEHPFGIGHVAIQFHL